MIHEIQDAPVIASRNYRDLVLISNPHIPECYFARGAECPSSSAQLGQELGELEGWVWLRLSSDYRNPTDVAKFAVEILPNVNQPIRLITTDGDNSVPSYLPTALAETILTNPHVESWHTQNYDQSIVHPKLKGIPIGLDLHSGGDPADKLSQLTSIARNAPSFERRKSAILFDATAKSHWDRDVLSWLAPSLKHVEIMDKRVSFSEAMQRYAEHQFVLSPRGNGLDCHRTWEALFLGCVPIVRSGPLDVLYARGLPVVVLQTWNEIYDPENLQRWRREIRAPKPVSAQYMRRSFWLS